jgi:hypothetical protein
LVAEFHALSFLSNLIQLLLKDQAGERPQQRPKRHPDSRRDRSPGDAAGGLPHLRRRHPGASGQADDEHSRK